MKKTIIKILLILFLTVNIFGTSYAEAKPIKVKVTEKIPGVPCDPRVGSTLTGTYECTVEPGFGSVVDMAGGIIKWLTYLVALAGVLFIVVNGILYSMGEKEETKKRIIASLLGLVLLFLSGLILNIIAPWVYTSS